MPGPSRGRHAKHAAPSQRHSSNQEHHSVRRPSGAPYQPAVTPVMPAQEAQVLQSKQAKQPSKALNVVFWIALAVFVVSLAVLAVIAWSYFSADQRYKEISKMADVNTGLDSMTVDWDGLRAINPDIVGWVYVPGTPINYPVVKGTTNDEYLNKNFDGVTGLASGCGTIFLDSSNASNFSDPGNFLFGHHRRDGSMFAAISDYAEQGYFDDHRDIYVLTPNRNYHLSAFALVRTTGSDALVETTFSNHVAMEDYLEDKAKRSLVVPKDGFPDFALVEKFFALGTCDYNESDGRAVLFANMIEVASVSADADTMVATTDSVKTTEE